MIPNDTQLASFIRDFGDTVMQITTDHLYKSPIGQLFLYVSAVFMFISLAIAFSQEKFPRYTFIFCLTWGFCLPFQGKPVVYTVINTVSSQLAIELQKINMKILKGASGKGIPPGYVMNTLFKASTSEIKDEEVRKKLRFVLDNCIPSGNNFDGAPISAKDLLGPEYLVKNGSELIRFNFDTKLIESRRFSFNESDIDCFTLTKETILAIRRELNTRNITSPINQLYVGTADTPETDRVVDWKEVSDDAKLVGNLAVNLAQANAIQRAALSEYLGVDASALRSSASKNPVAFLSALETDGSRAVSTPTQVTLDVMSFPNVILDSLGIKGFYGSAQSLFEINEKLQNLPYYISFIQLILKIIAPLAFLLVFIGRWTPLIMWASSWALSLVMPWILMITRSVSNSLIIWVMKLKEPTQLMAGMPKNLLFKIDFDAVGKIAEDSTRMMDVILKCELAIWGVLFLALAGGSWFAGNQANKLSEKIAGTVGSTLGRLAAQKGVSKVGSVASSVGKKAGLAIASSALRTSLPVVGAASFVGKKIGNYFSGLKGKKP